MTSQKKKYNTKTVLIYTITLIAAPLAWMPFSYSTDFKKLWICGIILALGSAYTLKQIAIKKETSKYLGMAMQKLRISAFITFLFAIVLIVVSFF